MYLDGYSVSYALIALKFPGFKKTVKLDVLSPPRTNVSSLALTQDT